MKIFLSIFITILLFKNNTVLVTQTFYGYNLWFYKLLPSMLPVLVLMDYILSTNLLNNLAKILKKISILLKLNVYAIPIAIISFFSGTPANAKLINNLYCQKLINEKEITQILCLTLSFNPLFLLNYLKIKYIIILILSNLLSTILLNNNTPKCEFNAFKPTKFKLENSIDNNFSIILKILGIVIFFYILNGIIPIKNVLIKSILSGILEITSGLDIINRHMTDIGKLIFSIIIISFGSISILLQIKSVLKDTSINLKYFFLNRLLSLFIALSLTIASYYLCSM